MKKVRKLSDVKGEIVESKVKKAVAAPLLDDKIIAALEAQRDLVTDALNQINKIHVHNKYDIVVNNESLTKAVRLLEKAIASKPKKWTFSISRTRLGNVQSITAVSK